MDERERIDEAAESWARIVPDLDVVTMRTALLLARVTALGAKHIESAFADEGLSAGEFDVLASLMHVPAHTSKPSVLARTGMLSPAGMTHRLDLLEQAGLVERRPDPADRRSTLIVLTEAGEAKAIDAARTHVAAEAEILQVLSAGKQAELRQLLETMLDAYAMANTGRTDTEN